MAWKSRTAGSRSAAARARGDAIPVDAGRVGSVGSFYAGAWWRSLECWPRSGGEPGRSESALVRIPLAPVGPQREERRHADVDEGPDPDRVGQRRDQGREPPADRGRDT